MSPEVDPRQAAIMRLNALTLENYRQARWAAIDAARTLDMTWIEIGEALGMEKSATRRLWLAGNKTQ